MSDIFNIDIKSNFKFIKKYKKIYYFLSKFKNVIFIFLAILIFPIMICEVIIFLFLNKKKIFSNKTILPFYNWSFGHQIVGFDYYSRAYYPNKISLIFIIHKRNNPYLHLCFQNIDCVTFKSRFFGNKQNLFCSIYKKIFNFFLMIVSIINDKYHIVEHLNIYKILTNPKVKQLRNYNYTKDDLVEYQTNLTGYYYLLKNDIGASPKLKNNLKAKIEENILKLYPNFNKNKFVCILLRKSRSLNYYDSFRDSGDQNRFRKSLKHFSDQGYSIVSSGESEEIIFEDIPNFISSKKITSLNEVDYYLLNLYYLLYSSTLICQHSGPYILSNSAKVPCVIIDSFPFFHGSYNPDDRIMFKKVTYHGKSLSLKDIQNNHHLILYGKCKLQDGYNTLESTEEEIFDTIFTENFKSIEFNDDLLIKYTENKKIFYWG